MLHARVSNNLKLGMTALAFACLYALPATHASAATTIQVTNCRDTGPGSLRDAASRAVSGDAIDLRSAGCGRIKLAGQPIALPQSNLRIVGPGRYKMVIDGDYKSSVLRHTGANTLWIHGVSIEHGMHRAYTGDGIARGGCIYSDGIVRIDQTEVRHCGAYGTKAAQGGGIFAAKEVISNSSALFSNDAIGFNQALAEGGAIYAVRQVKLTKSRVLVNSVSSKSSSPAGEASSGGGIYTDAINSNASTIARNYSGRYGGGVYLAGAGDSPDNSKISGSTISGNVAEYAGGGLYSDVDGPVELHVDESTISGNRALIAPALLTSGDIRLYFLTAAFNVSDLNGNGEICDAGTKSAAVVLMGNPFSQIGNTIMSNNKCGSRPGYDLWSDAGQISISELNVITASKMPLSPDTVTADPRLGPLADNGGPTQTHALGAGSSAIDIGTNTYLGAGPWDQRGPGYPRLKGKERDAGAYEK